MNNPVNDISIPSYFAIILAGGTGKRFMQSHGVSGNQTAKQYQLLLGKTVLEHSVDRVCAALMPTRTVLTHPKDDTQIKKLSFALPVDFVVGGAERMYSVIHALEYLKPFSKDDDFVLIHDAARPCVSKKDILKLVNSTENHPVGGLLATPVTDTIKLVENGLVTQTIPRNQLWAAQTPQLFRFGLLLDALKQAAQNDWQVTDDASALELAGFKPLIVEGSPNNIKITHASDLNLAKAYMYEV